MNVNEFNLSEKGFCFEVSDAVMKLQRRFYEKDVKEFIKLRDIWVNRYIRGEIDQYELRVELDKLAGSKLLQGG